MTVPYDDAAVEESSCYVMPVMVARADLRESIRGIMLQRFGVQTSVLYPALHELTAYREMASSELPRAEHVARSQLTLPLFPHMTERQQDLVIEALAGGLDEAGRNAG